MCRHAPCNKLHLVVQKFHFRRNLKSFPGFRNSHKKAGNHQNCSTTRDGSSAVNVKLSFVRELSIILLFEICVALWSRADFRALKMISYGLDRTYLGVGPTYLARTKSISEAENHHSPHTATRSEMWSHIFKLYYDRTFQSFRAQSTCIFIMNNFSYTHVTYQACSSVWRSTKHQVCLCFIRCDDIRIYPKKSPTHPQKSPIYPQKSLIYRSTIRHHSSRAIHVYLS